MRILDNAKPIGVSLSGVAFGDVFTFIHQRDINNLARKENSSGDYWREKNASNTTPFILTDMGDIDEYIVIAAERGFVFKSKNVKVATKRNSKLSIEE